MIDSEVAKLRAHRETLDHDGLAAIRALAPDLALFDPSKEATLARRYEATAERMMYRALREMRQVEGEHRDRPEPSPSPSPSAAAVADRMGSFLQEILGDLASAPDPAPRPVPAPSRTPEGPLRDRFEPTSPADLVPITVGRRV